MVFVTMYHILTYARCTSFVPRSRAKVMHGVHFAVDKAFLDDQFGDPGPWFGSGVRFVVLWMSLDNKQGVVLPPLLTTHTSLYLFFFLFHSLLALSACLVFLSFFLSCCLLRLPQYGNQTNQAFFLSFIPSFLPSSSWGGYIYRM